MSAFIITRIQTGDYDSWRPMFDQDRPQTLLDRFEGKHGPNVVEEEAS